MEILEGPDDSKHFSISSEIILLCMVKFTIKIRYRMEVCFHGLFLQKYRTKGFGTSVHVYLLLGVVGVIKYL